MMLRRLLSCLLICALALSAQALTYKTDKDVSEALNELDDVLSKRSVYIAERQKRIDALNDSIARHKGSNLKLLWDIAEQYRGFENDSAISYLDRGIALAPNRAEAIPFKLQRATLLPLVGFFETAINAFDSIDPDEVSNATLPLYYDSGRQMYSYLAAFYASYPKVSALYRDKALKLQRQLLEVLPHDSESYHFNLGEYYFIIGDNAKAEPLLIEVAEREPSNSNLRARATHHLSAIAKSTGDGQAYLYYLTQSAISDALTATREVASLQELGQRLYERNDIDRAYVYLSTALTNAVECGAPLRMVETSRALPIIERANAANMERRRNTIYIIIGLMALLLAGLLCSLIILRRENTRQHALQRRLRDANHVKEVYISQFLSLCSIYMDKLNQFCKIAERKIASGKVDDLYRLTKSGKFVEEQSAEFYEVFDNAFLHIYPSFVEGVNALLRPDAQIVLREGERLNTDLRILAFMRLGIEDSARIAQVLNYSLNTIYSYRNRLKARAINRDTFERDIMTISSVNVE
ncbi:MAG: DUF6377 domain-containing protein [Muribaculaceae bacterium]